MKNHFANLSLLAVLLGLLSMPILGYGMLMSYEPANQVLSETDTRGDVLDEPINYDFRHVTIENEENTVEDITELREEDTFNPSEYFPAQNE